MVIFHSYVSLPEGIYFIKNRVSSPRGLRKNRDLPNRPPKWGACAPAAYRSRPTTGPPTEKNKNCASPEKKMDVEQLKWEGIKTVWGNV